MTVYNYKKFKIHYNIQGDKTKKNLYTADGYVLCSPDQEDTDLKQCFHTEYTTREGVQKEIKRLIENYIDFEWKEFYEMHGKEQRKN